MIGTSTDQMIRLVSGSVDLDGTDLESREENLKTEIYEADPFTSRKGKLLATFDSDYRLERQDELFLDGAEKAIKVRVIHVALRLSGGELQRELLVMQL